MTTEAAGDAALVSPEGAPSSPEPPASCTRCLSWFCKISFSAASFSCSAASSAPPSSPPRLAPPFRIHCVYTDVEPERRLREVVTGDLSGVLETLFEEEGSGTHVVFNWCVRVTNPALNLLGYVAGGVYRRSHDSVMESGVGSAVRLRLPSRGSPRGPALSRGFPPSGPKEAPAGAEDASTAGASPPGFSRLPVLHMLATLPPSTR